MHYCPPQFKREYFLFFFCMGLCPTCILPYAGNVDAQWASDLFTTAEIAWTRVHAIIKSRGDTIKGLPGDTWSRHEHPIVIAV